MANYISQTDLDNYGHDLIDVTQRAALQAVEPHLQNLESQNAELQRRLAIEARRRLDDQVARAVPDLKQVDRDPRWHRWLLGIDSLSGRVRQTLLNDAISHSDAGRVKQFFDQFKREAGAQAPAATQTTTSRRGPFSRTGSPPLGSRTYTPQQIQQLYEKRRRGEFKDETWNRIEQDFFAAQKDGRVLMQPYLTK
jgi:hypothetical protein